MKSNFRDSPGLVRTDAGLVVFSRGAFGSRFGNFSRHHRASQKEGEAVLDTTMPVGEFQIFNQAAKEKCPFLNIRPCASTDIDRLLDSGNLHVIRTEGEYSRYMKLYLEVSGTL